jgi:D-xylonolactonase
VGQKGGDLAELEHAVEALLGEGPVWDSARTSLFWVDILGNRIFCSRPSEADVTTHQLTESVTSLHPSIHGDFVCTTRDSFCRLSLPSCDLAPILKVNDIATNRFNDGQIDNLGRVWAGTMDEREIYPTGTLFCLDELQRCLIKDSGYVVANGPAFNRLGTRFYHADSSKREIYVFDLDSSGRPLSKQLFCRFPETYGFPDGMTVDQEDCLWVACWEGWAVRRFSPQGELLECVRVPASLVSSCTFGGDDCGDLYITTARKGLSELEIGSQPYAGGLFKFRPAVPGFSLPPCII